MRLLARPRELQKSDKSASAISSTSLPISRLHGTCPLSASLEHDMHRVFGCPMFFDLEAEFP
jgi:hypothetical protein